MKSYFEKIKRKLVSFYITVTEMDWSELRAIKNASFWTLHMIWFSVYPVLHKSSLIVNNTINISFHFIPIKMNALEIEMPFSLLILYIGSLCIVLANIIYHVKCPKLIKQFIDYGEFKKTGMDLSFLRYIAEQDHPPQKDFIKELRSTEPDHPESSKEYLFTTIFLKSNNLYKKSRYVSGLLFAAGFSSVAFIAGQNIFYVFSG